MPMYNMYLYIVHVLYVTICFVEVASDYNVPVYSTASCNFCTYANMHK